VTCLSYVLATAGPGSGPLTGADIVQYVITAVNLGVLGIVFWLFVQGKIHSDSELSRLTAENARLVAEKTHAEQMRDDLERIARDDLIPLLTSFTATSSALLPLLQDLVRQREGRSGRDSGARR